MHGLIGVIFLIPLDDYSVFLERECREFRGIQIVGAIGCATNLCFSLLKLGVKLRPRRVHALVGLGGLLPGRPGEFNEVRMDMEDAVMLETRYTKNI